MRKMAAGSFKIHRLAVMDEVQAKRESVLITKHGKPVATMRGRTMTAWPSPISPSWN